MNFHQLFEDLLYEWICIFLHQNELIFLILLSTTFWSIPVSTWFVCLSSLIYEGRTSVVTDIKVLLHSELSNISEQLSVRLPWTFLPETILKSFLEYLGHGEKRHVIQRCLEWLEERPPHWETGSLNKPPVRQQCTSYLGALTFATLVSHHMPASQLQIMGGVTEQGRFCSGNHWVAERQWAQRCHSWAPWLILRVCAWASCSEGKQPQSVLYKYCHSTKVCFKANS